MRRHLSNAFYGVLDYAAQPILMLVAAPILLKHLGLAAYGVWLISSAAVGAGSVVSSGFGDAVIQRVASLRSKNNTDEIRLVIANVLAINLLLSGALAGLLWILIPFVVVRVTHFNPELQRSCLWSLRIGALLIVLKSFESVFLCTQRAYERYAPAVVISITVRLLSTGLVIGLALLGFGVSALMLGTLALVAIGTFLQATALRRHLGSGLLVLRLDRATAGTLLSFGGFSWLQAVAGVIFSQADRLLLGTMLGASAVSYYGVCVQMAQPIHGLTAAGLHFLFPHLTLRFALRQASETRRSVLTALGFNIFLAAILTSALVFLGGRILRLWLGADFASHTTGLLPLLAAGFGLLALNVTGHYTLLALGKVRLVALLNVAAGCLLLVTMMILVPLRGVQGAAVARIFYGPITCLLYLPLCRLLGKAAPRPIALDHLRTEEA